MNSTIGTLKYLLLLSTSAVLACSVLTGCSTFSSNKPTQVDADEPPYISARTGIGETYYDGNRAPANMSPPFDMGPEKIVLDPIYLRTKADYHFALGETFSYEGDAARAIEEYKLTSVYDPTAALVRVKLAVEFIKKGLLSEAMTHAEEAVKIDPNLIEGRLLLGGVYSAVKLYDRAEEQYRLAIKKDKEAKEAYLYLGALLTEQKKYSEAIEVFKGLAKDSQYESQHLAYFYLARVYVEKGDKKNAEANFIKALSLKPNFTEGVVALGIYYESEKEPKRAVKLFESYQDKHGPNEKVAEQLARLYLEDEQYQKAYDQLDIVVAADPDNLNARVRLALVLIELKDYKKAVTRLKEILAQAPDSDKIRFFLGAVYEEVKDYQSAITQFNVLTPNSSYYVEAMVHSSYLYKLQNDYPSAIATIEKAIELRPDAYQFYPLYASYLDDTTQYEKAVKMLRQAVIRFPDNDQLYFFLGSMQDKIGNKEDTIVSLQKAIELNPEHVQALNFLAYTFADMGQRLNDAYSYAKRALQLKPDDAYIQDTVGWIYYKRGEYADAVRTLETAHKLKNDESIIAEHLGDAYYQYKLPIKAKEMYKRALRYEKNDETIRKLEEKIAGIENTERKDRIPASHGE